jgi:hypothetical protein
MCWLGSAQTLLWLIPLFFEQNYLYLDTSFSYPVLTSPHGQIDTPELNMVHYLSTVTENLPAESSLFDKVTS